MSNLHPRKSVVERRYDFVDLARAFLFGACVMGVILALIIVLAYRYVGF